MKLNTQEVINDTRFNVDQTKTMCEFSAYVAVDKATNGQTDIKQEKE